MAQEEGFCVCSGGIIGMGETWEDRLDMAISLAELGIESIPINALMPIPGTDTKIFCKNSFPVDTQMLHITAQMRKPS